jgi:hypothetical protein
MEFRRELLIVVFSSPTRIETNGIRASVIGIDRMLRLYPKVRRRNMRRSLGPLQGLETGKELRGEKGYIP